MAEKIVVNTTSLTSYANRIQRVINRVYNLNRRIRNLYYTQEVTGLYSFVTSNRFYNAISTLNSCKTYLIKTASDFETVERYFANVDPLNFVQPSRALLGMLNSSDENGIEGENLNQVGAGSSINRGDSDDGRGLVEQLFDLISENKDDISSIKSILDLLGKIDLGDGYRITSDGIGYVQSLIDFISGDYTNLLDVFSEGFEFAGSSASMWSGIYNFLEEAKKVVFTDQWKIGAAGVDLASSIFGFVGSYLSAFDTEGVGVAGIVSNFLDSAKKGVSVPIDIYKLVATIDGLDSSWLSKEVLGKVGDYEIGWSPMDVWKAIIQAGIGTASQAFDSIEKYGADGQWTLGDTSETMLDASLAGLYNIAHALTGGLADVLYSQLTDTPSSEMSYIEQAAEGYKILMKEVGSIIGSWFT